MKNVPSTKQLLSFVMAAREKNFSKAADILCLTQSAVSKNIIELEDKLGQKLFIRNQRDVSLTKVGAKYFSKIEHALDVINEATGEIKGDRKQEKIVINISPSISNIFINYLKTMYEEYPQVQITIENKEDCQNADIWIAAFQKEPSNSYLIAEENMLLIASKDYKTNSLDDIENNKFLFHSSRPGTFERMLKKNQIDANLVKNKVSFEHFYMIINAAKQGLGIGLVPDFLVKEDIEKSLLVNCHNVSFKSGFGYYLKYRDDKEVVKSFAFHLKNKILPNL